MTTTTTEAKYRTITLTGRPPVRVAEDSWPVIASASDKRWDNTYEFQANRTSKMAVRVRQHAADGRAVVYGTYDYSTAWQGEPNLHARTGELLPAGTSLSDIAAAIERVAADLAGQSEGDHFGLDAHRIGRECIADLPPELLD